jgi:HSP20 family protein
VTYARTAQYVFISSASVLPVEENIMRTTSFDDIDRLFERMNRVAGLDDGSWSDSMTEHSMRSVDARIDVAEHDEEIVIVADLPGFESEEIELSVDEDRLHISANHSQESIDQDVDYVHRERTNRSVQRSVSLPVSVDPERGSASYTNGVLTVTLPKLPGDSGHRIDIN